MLPSPLPAFDPSTQVFLRPKDFVVNIGADAKVSDPYTVAAYQYATSCRPELCQPAAIIYPANGNVTDIQRTIKFAYDHGIAVAVRSGGHHFSGFSSTNGDNIQLDMSSFNSISPYNEVDKTYTVGAGCKLKDMDKVLAAADRFVPHGMCSWVAIGGHMQSGGFSVNCGRSFGFFVDHVTQFSIVMAPNSANEQPQTVEVRRPVKGDTTDENDELWFAIVGGSPGNFGVVTHVTIKPLSDRDYPGTRVENIVFPYTKGFYLKCMELVAKYGNDDDLPANFNLTMGLFQGNTLRVLDQNTNIDVAMSKKHPEKYGPRAPWLPFPVLYLTAMWVNLSGEEHAFEKNRQAQDFFKTINAMKAEIMASASFIKSKLLYAGLMANPDAPMQLMNSSKPVAISAAARTLAFPQRVQANPYKSATNIGPHKMPDDYPAWATELVDQASNGSQLWPGIGMVIFGGKHSMCRNDNCPAPSALAHRDMGYLNLYMVHYDNVVDRANTTAPHNLALQNCNAIAAGADKYFGGDRRWNMFPHQNEYSDSPFGDSSLDRLKQHYFDSDEVYERVLATKRAVDPKNVFTPNPFCVGASHLESTKRMAAESVTPASHRRTRSDAINGSVAREESVPCKEKDNVRRTQGGVTRT